MSPVNLMAPVLNSPENVFVLLVGKERIVTKFTAQVVMSEEGIVKMGSVFVTNSGLESCVKYLVVLVQTILIVERVMLILVEDAIK